MTSEGASSTTPGTPSDGAAPGDAARFRQVLEAEWAQIRQRREVWGLREAPSEDGEAPDPCRPPPDLVGVAFSGGGIRSATFALGLLQGMAERGMLRTVDYLSTVSGGGYTGGWWTAWLSRKGRKPRDLFPSPEQNEAERWGDRSHARDGVRKPAALLPQEPAQEGAEPAPPPDASLSARQRDPIHHLRLFANYLTPRKGLLSADSWRAATVVSRNLVLTWLVLLPLLLAGVVAGQVYFTFAADPDRNWLREFPVEYGAPAADQVRDSPPAAAAADAAALQARADLALQEAEAAARAERVAVIQERAGVAARPLIVLFIWMVLLTLVWMVHGSRGGVWTLLATVVGAGAAVAIGWVVYGTVRSDGGGAGGGLEPGWIFLLGAGALILLVICQAVPLSLLPSWLRRKGGKPPPEDLLRNRVVRAHGVILVAMVALGAILALAGFSHDLVWYLFDPASGGPLPTWVKQTGGWAAVLATLGSMLFTGYMGAPAGGDMQDESRPRLPSRIVFAAAPILSLAFLAIVAAVAGRRLISGLGHPEAAWDLVAPVTLLAIGLFLAFAIYESYDRSEGDPPAKSRHVQVAGIGALAGLLFWMLGPDAAALNLRQAALWVVVAWGVLLLGLGWASPDGSARPADPATPRVTLRGRLTGMMTGESGHLVWGALLLALAMGGWIVRMLVNPTIGSARHVAARAGGPGAFDFPTAGLMAPRLLLGLALACAAFAAAERIFLASERRRALALATTALVALSALALIPFLPVDAATIRYSLAAVIVMTLALAWVVGLGWMANPNMLSLHAFYRARLVRAYLGASNVNRHAETITESAEGDDLPLRSVATCAVGAPYPLINTTLNLVGGRDLATAQRSAESFLMSPLYCGSARTGYRPTRQYMGGTVTLGAAVAISGAAASPNMGSQTPTAALSMLLALLNVRLAFWAPTPNRPFWRDARVRLWPYYVLRELLSQTDELSAYSCLSDGGHFDNTGLYSLVSRGCRYIVLSDCGADPQPCFQDLGNAIRRCRIDFGTEIDLRIDPFIPAKESGAAAHFTVGSIRYTRAHAEALGWREPITEEELRGTIIWMKPALTLTDEPADLRQYAIQNPVFPQQPTSDQWYDEAQFESYRRLGMHTAEEVFAAEFPQAATGRSAREYFEPLRPPESRPRTHFNIDVTTADGRAVLQIVELPPATGTRT
jgi:hypothetical protein